MGIVAFIAFIALGGVEHNHLDHSRKRHPRWAAFQEDMASRQCVTQGRRACNIIIIIIIIIITSKTTAMDGCLNTRFLGG
jgi:hypothetical protein